MYCQNCGNELKPGAKFCQDCGAKLQASIPVRLEAFAAAVSNNGRKQAMRLLILSIVGLACGTELYAAAACFVLSDQVFDMSFALDVPATFLAYASIVLLILVAPVASVLGVVFSAIARSYAADLRRSGEPSRRRELSRKAKLGSILSIVGLIVGILSCLLMIAWIVYHLAVPSADFQLFETACLRAACYAAMNRVTERGFLLCIVKTAAPR